ncbi:MAG: ABC transporter ATP-binding protein [Anaerolineae bacterium]|jgi:ATP-binding cassette subfamily B protein/subfamily B ATP-binding cassette protein MsbA
MFGGPMGHMRNAREEKAQDAGQTLQRLGVYLKPHWLGLLAVGLLIIVDTLLQLAGPYLIGRAVDQFIIVGDRSGLTITMLLLLGVYLGAWATRYGEFYGMIIIGNRVLLKLRAHIFERIQSLSLKFFDEHEAGDLMSRLTNDVDTIGQVLNAGLVQTISSALLIVGILVTMFSLSWQLALATFVIVPFMFASSIIFSRRARRAFRETRKTIGSVSADLEENISGVRVAQAFAREDENIQRFSELNRANRDANVSAQSVVAAFSPTLDVLSTIGLAIVIGFGGYLALQTPPAITVGIIVSFLVYVRRFFQPIQQLAQLYAQLQSAVAGAERIFELIDTQSDLVDRPKAVEMPLIRGRVEFDGVSFHYKPEEPVLRDVSLVAEPGQTVALVGPTGAGKTTLVNLMGRFYEAEEGTVRIDDQDIRDVTRASLRAQMGIVLQDTFLFSGTILDNIRYGRLNATDEEAIEAAELANADAFITRLPEGYQTELSEQGRNLSQGQRQLIAIARAILADPRLLILDEATSSVDTRTELLIQQALGRLLKDRTSFVIAHRLSTIRNADQLLILQHGEVVERAASTSEKSAHQQLLDLGGEYYKLYTSQFRREDLEAGQIQSASQREAPGGDGRLATAPVV